MHYPQLSHYCHERRMQWRWPARICLTVMLLLLTGCTAPVTQIIPDLQLRPKNQVSDGDEGRKLLVFFDGTANDWRSRTNIRRLFEMVAVEENPKVISLYMDGVGSSSVKLTGGVFGFGMKPRIIEGYTFLAKNYRKNDEIYIFGFSRGAHQARALAGMLAYCGLIEGGAITESELAREADTIWDLNRFAEEIDDATWQDWQPSDKAPLAERHGLASRVVEVRFLGIWDTVPGSQAKVYEDYTEAVDGKKGIRYKSQPYPTIRVIAHALALDEKRSQFKPLFVRKPIDETRTILHQVWFPGAHADVGGGYADSNDLAGISLNWMIELLEGEGLFSGPPPKVYSDPAGLAHWSLAEAPGNAGSRYEDRNDTLTDLPATFHPSVQERTKLAGVKGVNGGVPVRSCKPAAGKKEISLEPYPLPDGRCYQKSK